LPEKFSVWRVIASGTVGLLAPFVLPDFLEPPTRFPVLLNLLVRDLWPTDRVQNIIGAEAGVLSPLFIG
jgi:hypothetical protein